MFKDFNFKLAVVNTLYGLDENISFKEVLDEKIKLYTANYEWYESETFTPIPALKDYIEKLDIPQAELDLIESIDIETADGLYMELIPDWDGEDDIYEIKSVEGFEKLSNLKHFEIAYGAAYPECFIPLKAAGIEVIINDETLEAYLADK
ncbi:DUF6892 domain-containing protein [Macrococcus animalis]|uniref:DUF6892 domain-containing protein n=1 Tax=Macrococcus animalis TaxID=3395467 RepID=UPI0039BEAF2A